jgi:D-xylonolactonase
VYLLDENDEKHKLELLFEFPFAENEMFNDITVDPMGRIFAGTLVRPDMTGGTLYRLEKGKQPVAVLKDLHCSNGMTFSLDEKYFYHTDSTFQTIKRYEYDRATGDIANPSVYFKGEPEMGVPDGLTMDSEGCIWSAFWGGSRIRRLDPDGRIIEEVEVPAKQPSSVMFGGAGLKELYITTASEGADDIVSGCSSEGVFFGGPVYRHIPGVAGRPEWLADF